MHDDHTTEAMEQARIDYERKQFQNPEKYTPRPRWQIVFAWRSSPLSFWVLSTSAICR